MTNSKNTINYRGKLITTTEEYIRVFQREYKTYSLELFYSYIKDKLSLVANPDDESIEMPDKIKIHPNGRIEPWYENSLDVLKKKEVWYLIDNILRFYDDYRSAKCLIKHKHVSISSIKNIDMFIKFLNIYAIQTDLLWTIYKNELKNNYEVAVESKSDHKHEEYVISIEPKNTNIEDYFNLKIKYDDFDNVYEVNNLNVSDKSKDEIKNIIAEMVSNAIES